MSETPNVFTVKFGEIARTLDYEDPEAHLVFTFDLGSGGDKSICLEHYPARKQIAQHYGVAFERTRQYLESCGYQVEIYGSLAGSTCVKADDISDLIQGELAGWSRPQNSRLDLSECLIPPKRATYVAHPGNDTWDLWLVFEERPKTKDGYKIIFDEHSKQFGVARDNLFIGFEGTFIQTLNAIFNSD